MLPSGLRNAGDADEAVGLDVGERGLDQRRHARIVGDLHVQHGAVARLERQHGAVGLLDLAADAGRLLRERRRSTARLNAMAAATERAPRHIHVYAS